MGNRSMLLLHIDMRAMDRAPSCIQSRSYQEGVEIVELGQIAWIVPKFRANCPVRRILGMDPANGCRVKSTLMHEEARGWCEVAESRKSHIMLGNVDTQRQ